MTIEDLDALVGVVAGVNVKLAKCGGVGPARRMLERARTLGFRTLLGCMEETSIGIAASAAVAPLADWVDLDGCLLLAEDPATGLELGPDKRWRTSPAPGLGVTLGPAVRPGTDPGPARQGVASTGFRDRSRTVHRGFAGCGQVGAQHGGEAPYRNRARTA